MLCNYHVGHTRPTQKLNNWAGEMAQRISALAAFLEVLNPILNPGSLQEQQVLLMTEKTLQPP